MEGIEHANNTGDEHIRVQVMVNVNPLDNLKQMSQLLPPENRKFFAKKYGSILDLLFISVEVSALTTLAQYWNSSLRCFELPNLDVTPTIEEYACMLGLPMRRDTTVYFYLEHHSSVTRVVEQFAELLGLPMSQVKLAGQRNSQGLTRGFLEGHLMDLAHRDDWVTFLRVLALTIYGLVLFPSALNMVDQAAMDVFFAVENKNRNPTPAILAETFLTLEFCLQKRKGKIRCCVQLLYVWIITHMYAGSHIHKLSDPLRSFHKIPIKRWDESQWKVEFDSIEGRLFKWICPWYELKRGDIIYSCGEFPNVPLMGPRGCIAYTPTIVLKQLGWTQGKPQEDRLGGFCFWYKDDDGAKIWSKEIREAWKNIRRAGKAELGKPLLINTSEYVVWREARKIPNNVPRMTPQNNDSSQPMAQMAEQLEVMKAQIQSLSQQKQEAELQVFIVKEKYEKMKKRVEHLQDECADVTEASRMRKGKEKVSEELSGKIQEFEEKVQSLSIENCELKKGIEQRDRMGEKFQAEANRHKQARGKLGKGIYLQSQVRMQLEHKIEELTTLLKQTKIDRDQGWASSDQYHSLFVETTNAGNWWKSEALDRDEEIIELKKKYTSLIAELNIHVPNFVHRFEKANEEILAKPMLDLPQAVDDFMEMCGGLARGLKRRKTGLLIKDN